MLAKVQRGLDAQREIHIRPQQAAFPAERVQKVAHALEDPTVSLDTIRRRANAPVANVAKSMHDDYIKENAKFRSNAGLKCWIVRTTDGKCCKWQADMSMAASQAMYTAAMIIAAAPPSMRTADSGRMCGARRNGKLPQPMQEPPNPPS